MGEAERRAGVRIFSELKSNQGRTPKKKFLIRLKLPIYPAKGFEPTGGELRYDPIGSIRGRRYTIAILSEFALAPKALRFSSKRISSVPLRRLPFRRGTSGHERRASRWASLSARREARTT